ncbi:MAG: carboxypeptidase regulatory-like domain-containing protein, partial [Thermoplasmata archaeon]|nr:carboxypeptidase regulatory-like domain-containing protein [Thermoplasmata archaeon]
NSGFYSPGRLFLNTRSGNDIWLNITLRPQPLTYQLRGRVNESDNSPVIGATVTARYGARDFITITDATGKYTLDVPEGSPRISVRMDGYGYEGDEYISISSWGSSLYWQNLTLDTQNAWIELPITDSVVDIDGDGKYDWLYIDVTVNVAIAGEYDIDGDLYSDYWLTSSDGGISGTMSANAGNSSYLDPGLRIVRLAFYGPQVSYVGDGGFVIEIDLYDRDAGWDNIDLQYYFTNPYNSSDFDLPDLKDVDPPHSFGPLDTDFDGLYNVLMFNSTVEILAPGTYTFISRLYNVPAADNWQDEEIDQSYLTETLDVGIHTMEFSFSGSNIYNSGSHLGIASTMMMNGTGDMDENTMVWASQCYVPYNYTQFQNYPIDSYVYGWVNDTGSTPIANISVEIFNKTSRFVNRTLTDENGYFELGGWDADWILVMNDGDDTSQKYQGNLTSITLTTGTPLEINQELYDEILDSNEQTIIFDPNNWNKTVVDMMMRILIDNETIRYEFDMYEFGNGDGFISESETDMLMGFIGSMVQMPANLADEMNVDGITYDLDPGSAIYDIGIVGDVASKEPVYIHQKANFTANTSILAGSPHELNINMTYDNINTGSVSDGNSTTICYVYPPIGWGRTGNNDTANIVFSGTDEIIIDPLMDPIPGDGNESEWTNVTISDSQTPTVGTISGNVTLDGRSNH